jgi:hypothetical protein
MLKYFEKVRQYFVHLVALDIALSKVSGEKVQTKIEKHLTPVG